MPSRFLRPPGPDGKEQVLFEWVLARNSRRIECGCLCRSLIWLFPPRLFDEIEEFSRPTAHLPALGGAYPSRGTIFLNLLFFLSQSIKCRKCNWRTLPAFWTPGFDLRLPRVLCQPRFWVREDKRPALVLGPSMGQTCCVFPL